MLFEERARAYPDGLQQSYIVLEFRRNVNSGIPEATEFSILVMQLI